MIYYKYHPLKYFNINGGSVTKKALLSILVVALLVSIAGCSTAPNVVQHTTPTPIATLAPSATSATVLSGNGLSLTLSLNSTTYQYEDQISVTIDEKNTLARENNISASGNWPVFGYLGVGPCNTLNYPFGIALLQGYYDAKSIASATPLQIYPIVFCPCERVVVSYVFQPLSDIASRCTMWGDWLSPISMNTDVTLTGVCDRWIPINTSTGIAYQQATSNFIPGIYTLVGGDEWGTLVILYFSISNEAPDDIVITPAGMQYRANVHEAGVTNLWPAVQTTAVNLSENISVEYRSYIETQAGETRHSIIFVRATPIPPNQFPEVGLTTNNMTAGIEINQSSGGGFPGNTEQVLTINILSDVEPGEYTFDIGLVIDGEDYGQLPCTINVTN